MIIFVYFGKTIRSTLHVLFMVSTI